MDLGAFYHVRGMAFTPDSIIVVTPAHEWEILLNGVYDNDQGTTMPVTVDALDFGNLPTGNNQVTLDHIFIYDVERVDLTLDFTLKIMLNSGLEIRWSIHTI